MIYTGPIVLPAGNKHVLVRGYLAKPGLSPSGFWSSDRFYSGTLKDALRYGTRKEARKDMRMLQRKRSPDPRMRIISVEDAEVWEMEDILNGKTV